jgi:hypothetical protein
MRNQTVAKEDFAFGITAAAPWRVVEVESLGNYRLKVKNQLLSF